MADEQQHVSQVDEDKPSLYTRVGGYDGIYHFAAASLRKAMAHPDTGHIWAHMSESTFHKEHINFVDFLAAHWGGNVKYRGRDMATAHRGMGLTEVHWQAMFDCMEECYEEFDVAQDVREEIDAFLRKFKRVIIGSPSFRDVVLANPEMDITKGIKSVGVVWPESKQSSEVPKTPNSQD